ncbi:MAG: hypothetical protein ACD_58C00311G0002 [uncultured bacterium]|nr:MAG: hypothetical protein ACD_58C00311G0002 [uncultured bacterium]
MLIEIVVALGVLSLVLVGVSDLMTRSQRLSSYQTKKDEAYGLARNLLNDYRQQRDNNPGTFLSGVVGINRETCVEGKNYSCKVEVTKNASSVDLYITVSWPDGGNTLSVTSNQKLVIE